MATQNNRNKITLTTQNFIDAINGKNSEYYIEFQNYLTGTVLWFLSHWKEKADDSVVTNIVDDTITKCGAAITRGKRPANMKQYLRKAIKNALLDSKKINPDKVSMSSAIREEECKDEEAMLKPKYGYRDNNTVEDSIKESDLKEIAKDIFDYVKEKYKPEVYRILQVKFDWELTEEEHDQLKILCSKCREDNKKDSAYLEFLSQELGWSHTKILNKIDYYLERLGDYVPKHIISKRTYDELMSFIPKYQLSSILPTTELSLEEASKLICYFAFLQKNIDTLDLQICKRLPLEETLGEETLKLFRKIEDYQFDSDVTSEIRCMADVRKKVDLIIVDKEPINQLYQATIEGFNDSIQKIEDIKAELTRQRVENDPKVLKEIDLAKKTINDSKTKFEQEFQLGPDWENDLGMYTRYFPLLNISEPTIVLFRDAIEKDSSVVGYDGEEYTKRRNDLFTIVYTHELFHAYYDSPTYDKTPDSKIEETMANFGMLYLINSVFESGETILSAAEVHAMRFCLDDQPFEYYFGKVLYDQTIDYDDRFIIISKYRELSKYIDLSINWSEKFCLFKSVSNVSNVWKNIRYILNFENWYLWYSLNQLPRYQSHK